MPSPPSEGWKSPKRPLKQPQQSTGQMALRGAAKIVLDRRNLARLRCAMLDDLKNYRVPDAFQLIEASVAYDIFWIGLIVACIVL